MNYWLMKSEPSEYSIEDLQRDKVTHWDGVRNYQARKNMLKMKIGDLAFFYHSNANPSGIAGLMKIVKEAYPDFTAWDKKNEHYDPKSTPEKPIWYMVDVEFIKKLPKIISLEELKGHKELQNMVLFRSSRLSVQPVSPKEFKGIEKLLSLKKTGLKKSIKIV